MAQFKRLLPSGTAGNGRVVGNNANDGGGQGRAGSKRKAHCRFCGFPNDSKRIRTHSGTDDGNGAQGAITKTSETGTLLSGTTFTEKYGDSALRKGAGCSVCHSPDSTQ